MKNLKEFELKSLDQITGGITIKLEFTNVFDGNPKNDDVHLTAQAGSQNGVTKGMNESSSRV